MRLVVGLGNPGDEYEQTRHNVGFLVADRLAKDSDWKWFQNDLGLWTKVASVYVVKPMTYMNESGRCVQPFARFYKIKPEEVLVVYDEIALPLGRLRIRAGGSAGGHNGMKSIISSLGTDKFPRLRIGIGPQPAFIDSAAYVLQRFKSSEQPALEEALDKSAAAVQELAEKPLDAVMNRYNPKE